MNAGISKKKCVGICKLCGNYVWLMYTDRINGSMKHCYGCGAINGELEKEEYASINEMKDTVKSVLMQLNVDEPNIMVVRIIAQKIIGKRCEWRKMNNE